MTAYYNEWDSQAAAWLRELIGRGLIAPGDVDERSITDVQPEQLKGYTQHHFFAGIGGWSLALRSSGWPDARPVFTGSPPCQPFSTAGRGGGYSDERHLAPQWLRLVKALRPAFVFGEQVAAAVKKDDWLDDLLDALEAEGYATGAAVLPACGVGAPHIRQRLWVVARLGDGEQPGLEGHSRNGDRGQGREESPRSVAEAGESSGLEISSNSGTRHQSRKVGEQRRDALEGRSTCLRQGDRAFVPDRRHANGESSGLADAECWAAKRHGLKLGETPRGVQEEARKQRFRDDIGNGRSAVGLAQSDGTRSQPRGEAAKATGHRDSAQSACSADQHERASANQAGWDDPDWLYCRDGKWRPVESGTFPLADGLSARVGRLRGYGNAIVPQVAEEIIREMMLGNDQ